jgi:monoamine oxidase
MSYYVREVRDLEGVTPEQMAELGQRAAAGAAEAGPVSAGEILDSLGCAGPIGEALRARVEISTAVGVSEAAALALKHVASFEPLPSWRVGGGNELLPHAMALELGGGMRLGERVARVASLADGRVAVRTETGEATFDAAVVALPFAALRGADAVTPDLPDWKAEALGRVVQGHAAKLHLPLAALPPTSAVMSANGRYWTWTAREEGGAVAPVLNCFAGEKTHMARLRLGEGARFWAEDARQLRPDLAFAAGAPVLTDWPADPLTGGGYTAHSPAFRPEDAAALEAPVGRVYFAGEYCDPDFTGLMEGALRSGARAARALSSAAVPA